MVGEESVMEENTQVKKEEAEILENAQQNGEKKWKKYVPSASPEIFPSL